MGRSQKSLNIVSIGGGTGLSALLSGLKTFVADGRADDDSRLVGGGITIKTLTAVVTVTDDGGSSGRLREEFNILPPGDIRNCMVALSEDEKLLARLFQYRFPGTGDLQGHSFGNLFLTALTGVTGDFLEAVKLSSEVLAIRGRIFPSTTTDVVLTAELETGEIVRGESNISKSKSRIRRVRLCPEYCLPLNETLKAIKDADLITLGPGSLYTSVIPNLLVEGIAEAISRSKAIKIYISNIMTQPGETDGLGVAEHFEALLNASPLINIDYLIVNSRPISIESKEKYAAEGAVQIGLECVDKPVLRCGDRDIKIISADVLDEDDKVRHAPRKLAQLLIEIYSSRKSEQQASK